MPDGFEQERPVLEAIAYKVEQDNPVIDTQATEGVVTKVVKKKKKKDPSKKDKKDKVLSD